jgi:hypothetical protein
LISEGILPVNYKSHTLPVYQDKNWHIYIDPLLREFIDNNEITNNTILNLTQSITTYDNKLNAIESDIQKLSIKLYPVTRFTEINNQIYSLRELGDDWVIFRITDLGDSFMYEHVSKSNYPELSANAAYQIKETLVFLNFS